MSHFHNNMLLGSAGNQGAYEIEPSLRISYGDSSHLSRSVPTSTDTDTFTQSAWIKRTTLGTYTECAFFVFNGGNTLSYYWAFEANDQFRVASNTEGVQTHMYVRPARVFRDPSAWYHIVVAVDSTQTTDSDRIKIYVNGELAALDQTTYPTQNFSFPWNHNSYTQYIGRNDSSSGGNYLAEVYNIGGSQLQASDFGETDTDTGAWIPKEYTGSFGTNGFYLDFSDNSDTTATTLGKDSSGNNNNWTPNNFSVDPGVVDDSSEDTPTNNWCTFNPLKKGTITVSQGSLKAVGGADYQAIHGTIGLPSTGKFYWEATVDATSGAVTDQFVGVAGNNTALTGTSPYPQGDTPALYYVGTGSMTKNGSTVQTGLGTFAADDVIGVAYDADGATVQFYKNGTAVGTAESLPSTTETLFPAYIATQDRFANFNWGQRSFDQTPPTGFNALNTANLPVPTIKKGTDYFDTLIYTGNATARSITDLNFAPDFVWHKARSAADDHRLMDSVRAGGTDLSSAILFSNLADSEVSLTGELTQTSNGFDLVATTNFNNNGRTFVAWNWKESVDAGFDIVTDTGTGAAKTVSHNLGVAPKMIIRKSRTSGTGHWYVYHYEEGASEAGILQLNNAFAASTAWNSTAPTSSVFSVGSNVDENKLNDNFISYLFAEVDGFSKFGSYVGNGSTDGPFQYCGFSVAYLMVKKSSDTENWAIYDNKRNTINPLDEELFADDNADKYDGNRYIDFLSNGFKPRANSGTSNLSGETYVFMAFAENAFKYANAV